MSSFAPFKNLVYRRCGLHLEGLAEARLVRAIKDLKDSTGLTSTTHLIDQLDKDPVLFDKFISQLTVNETYFYRESNALQWLVNHYLPERLTEGRGPLAIFSAGCSSGEEPYSLAMMLYEHFGERAEAMFTITGGDVDKQVLIKARQAVYSGMAFRTLSPALKTRYFSPYGSRFKLNDSLRQWVTLCPFNLLDANESSPGGPFDVILFRNVSIYFDEPTRRHIHRQFLKLLAPQGIVLCGVTETLGNDLGVLTLAEAQGVFYFRRTGEAVAMPLSSLPTSLPASDSLSKNKDLTTSDPLFHAKHVKVEIAPGKIAPQDMTQQLHNAHQLLNQNAFTDADRLLKTLLEQQPWSIDALVLAGLVARWRQKPQTAYDHFKRAIYAAPECWPAHFYIAELYRQGELTDVPFQSKRSYAAVVRLLTAAPTSRGGLNIIAPPLPPGDARFLAERYLKALNMSLEATHPHRGVD